MYSLFEGSVKTHIAAAVCAIPSSTGATLDAARGFLFPDVAGKRPKSSNNVAKLQPNTCKPML